jgi:phosphopantothenoylcysteine decarboxylase/phosphopantothenate--cysteine ligase
MDEKKYKILVIVTGSIAAYKAAYLVSRLVQNNFAVKVVLSESARKFVGDATFEGLTDSPVYSDTFQAGKMMSHINLTKWADLAIVVPASANTINKFAAGIADNLITSLFLAFDFTKPFIISPAMNVQMYKHPATQSSIEKLKSWGIKVLNTDSGTLACGDLGEGRLLEPDEIFDVIVKTLADRNSNRKKVLITSGGTREKIDDVRFVTNLSTGKTAAAIADYFFMNMDDVTLLKSSSAVSPSHNVTAIGFDSFEDLKTKIKTELQNKKYDAVIHLAAVSDFSPSMLISGKEQFDLPIKKKLSSTIKNPEIKFKQNEKIVDNIKRWSDEKIFLAAFKFLTETDELNQKSEVDKIFKNSSADAVVYNNLKNRKNGVQKEFLIITKSGEKYKVEHSQKLAHKLSQLIKEQP